MGSQHAPRATLYLLGMLVTSCLGGSRWEDQELQVVLNGSHSLCQGQVEVHIQNTWHTVDNRSWDWHNSLQESLQQASKLCRKLDCGEALILGHFPRFKPPKNHPPVTCRGHVGSFAKCNASSSAQTKPLGLVCLEPPKKTPPPTSPPPTTTPAPTDPPRFLLVDAPRGLRCAGVLEVYMGGVIGSVHFDEAWDSAQGLENRICDSLQCGTFVKHLEGLSGSLPIRWRMANPTSCTFPEGCFLRVQPPDSGRPLALLCSEFQPKVQSRLVGGSGPCAGSVEVRQDGQWAALCRSKSKELWEEVCGEQRCGQFISDRELDASESVQGHPCSQKNLSQCHLLEEKRKCKRMFITCQDPNPAGLGAGSVMSIILALVLLALLLTVCGPLAYKKLVKKFRQKKQRQWIGPTEMSQNMSFHRHHTATVRTSAVNPTATHVENEYSQPPTSANTAYPALEGALRRISTQPDNSSDSDYDLQVTQRL